MTTRRDMSTIRDEDQLFSYDDVIRLVQDYSIYLEHRSGHRHHDQDKTESLRDVLLHSGKSSSYERFNMEYPPLVDESSGEQGSEARTKIESRATETAREIARIYIDDGPANISNLSTNRRVVKDNSSDQANGIISSRRVPESATSTRKPAADSATRKRLYLALLENSYWRFVVLDDSKVVEGVKMTIKLLDPFLNQALGDSPALLQLMARAWGKLVPLFSEATATTSGLGDLSEAYAALQRAGATDGPENLVQYAHFASIYRAKQASQTKEEMQVWYKAHPQHVAWVRIGTIILQLCYIITPKSRLFGILILHIMGLTANKIASMDETHRVVFMGIMTPSAGNGAINRLVPQDYADRIDVVVEGIIPTLEYAFCYNIKYYRDQMVPIFARHFTTSIDNDDIYDFSIKIFRHGPTSSTHTATLAMPSLEVIAGGSKFDINKTPYLKLAASHVRVDVSKHGERLMKPTAQFAQKVLEVQISSSIGTTLSEADQIKYSKIVKKPDGIVNSIFQQICPRLLFWSGFGDFSDEKGMDKVLNNLFSSSAVAEQANLPFTDIDQADDIEGKIKAFIFDVGGNIKLPDPKQSGVLFKSTIDVSDSAVRPKRSRKQIKSSQEGSRDIIIISSESESDDENERKKRRA